LYCGYTRKIGNDFRDPAKEGRHGDGYQARSSGRNAFFVLFNADNEAPILCALGMEQILRQALARDDWSLH